MRPSTGRVLVAGEDALSRGARVPSALRSLAGRARVPGAIRGAAGAAARAAGAALQPSGISASRAGSLGVARTFQIPQLFDSLSVLDNALVGLDPTLRSGPLEALGGSARARREAERADEQARSALQRVRLAELEGASFETLLRTPAGALSGAGRKRLELARAFALEPLLLLLDEPTAGLRRDEVSELRQLLEDERSGRTWSLLLVEHDRDFVDAVTSRQLVLERGRLLGETAARDGCAKDPSAASRVAR